jgi:hypothetical protein
MNTEETQAPTLEQDLRAVLNKHGVDNRLNTADHVLAANVVSYLDAYERVSDPHEEIRRLRQIVDTRHKDGTATFLVDWVYGATFCVACGQHLPVGERGEFVWVENDGRDGGRVGV